MVQINRHLLWLTSKTTNLPTLSEFFQLDFTSSKLLQVAAFAILYHAFNDAPHSRCLAEAALP
jgi:hypothetical protein